MSGMGRWGGGGLGLVWVAWAHKILLWMAWVKKNGQAKKNRHGFKCLASYQYPTENSII